MTPDIRRAAPRDAAAITEMIHALAEFEHAADQCTVTETQISAALFGDRPTVYGHVAEVDGEVAAMALWFVNFSTWDGVAGIYLEDLFVRPGFRRRGLGRALLAALAGECLQRGYTRLSWAVLNWNADAITLYDGIGGQPQKEWTTYRLSGPPLAGLAESP
ncbi:GCN5 family acetyltransferase [Mycobacterium marseillense]|uniref:GNAT family N-acetyltransferase n=1 Tax=Mycobacterium marseillense TaxID=701042 RepID=A0AAD0E1P5_9MYCO|nr:GNAT family N-acetyltransferase [Mycobacterium marseillense]ASW91731.1 GNAT family N-acetyltransferase [Mycobacterium marseillense]MCA2266605.1 GNAT family N-acetyltransferase [Mycobacterium marseillense]OBJ76377.1 GCN5 family acetyltransferase [Mycobacterium marseillense]